METEIVPADTVVRDDRTIRLNDAVLAERLLQKGFLIHSAGDDDRLLHDYRQDIQAPYISTAYFFITKNCNLACRYCFEKQSEVSNSNEGIMSAETGIEKGLRFSPALSGSNRSVSMKKRQLYSMAANPFTTKRFYSMPSIQSTSIRQQANYLQVPGC